MTHTTQATWPTGIAELIPADAAVEHTRRDSYAAWTVNGNTWALNATQRPGREPEITIRSQRALIVLAQPEPAAVEGHLRLLGAIA